VLDENELPGPREVVPAEMLLNMCGARIVGSADEREWSSSSAWPLSISWHAAAIAVAVEPAPAGTPGSKSSS
jgi:hypothetical protein